MKTKWRSKKIMRLLIIILAILVLPDSIFGITFSGRFTKDGKPLTRAIIDFIKFGEFMRRGNFAQVTLRLITDDDGRCVVRGIPEGYYILEIRYREEFMLAKMRVPCPNGKYDKLEIAHKTDTMLCGTEQPTEIDFK